MAVTSALVLLAVTWFMVMFVTLPFGLRTQGDEKKRLKGTHAGAPANFQLKRTVKKVTLIALVIWVVEVTAISTTDLTWHDLDWTESLPPVGEQR